MNEKLKHGTSRKNINYDVMIAQQQGIIIYS